MSTNNTGEYNSPQSKMDGNTSLQGDTQFPCPQHPLPEEIARLDKTDTVCQYCGISYFILHEIKQLKLELMSAKNEISDLKAYRNMYEELLQKWRSHVDLTEVNQSLLKEKDAQIVTLEQQNKTLKSDNCRVSELSQMLEVSKKNVELLSSRFADVFQKLGSFKANLHSLKATATSNFSLSATSVANMSNIVEQEVRKAYETNEKRFQNELTRQKRELTDKMHQREAEWKMLEVRLREADALSVQEMTKSKSQLLKLSEEANIKSNETIRLERENSDFRRQIEALKSSISALEKSLSAEQQRYIDMRNIVDQRAQDNQTLDGCIQRQQEELEKCRYALSEVEAKVKHEREELAENFSQQLKAIQNQMQLDIEKVQSDQQKQYEANQERLKQAVRRESDTRITAMQESFSNERHRFEAKFSQLTAELEACQQTSDNIIKSKETAENKALEMETRVKKLEGLLRQVHDEKLEATARAVKAENNIAVLHEIIANNIIERNRITDALNNIKQEIIKAKLPQEVFDELMHQVAELGVNPDGGVNPNGSANMNKLKNCEKNENSLRARAWSFDGENSSNNIFPSDAINGDVQKQLSADGAMRGRKSDAPENNKKMFGAANAKKIISRGDIASQLSPATLASIVEKRKQLLARQHGGAAFILPPIGPSSTTATNNNAFDNVASASITSSPLGLYQRNNSNNSFLSTTIDLGDNNGSAVPFRLNALSSTSNNHATVRQSMSESNVNGNRKPPPHPLGKLGGATDMRLKIAAILSRK